MHPLFNGWIGLLKILDSSGKLTITLDGGFANTKLGCKFGCCGASIILMRASLHGSRLGHGLLRPVVDPATEQAGGVGVEVAPAQLIAVTFITFAPVDAPM